MLTEEVAAGLLGDGVVPLSRLARRSLLRHVLWTVGIAGSGLLVGLYVPGINVVFQLMGSTCSAGVCFVLPAAFGLKLRLPEASGVVRLPAALMLLVGGSVVLGLGRAPCCSLRREALV